MAQDHGWLIKANPSGIWKRYVNIAAFEAANNPDAGQPGTQVDSNPNAVLARPSRQVVVDAGANDVLLVDEQKDVSVLAVFPVRFMPFGGGMIPMQPVPTSIAAGPDGAFYIGQLTGFPVPAGRGEGLSTRPRPGADRVRLGIHEHPRRRVRP